MKVKRALISVSNKQGIVEFAKSLSRLGIEILSSGGTAKVLREAAIAVQEVSQYTGFPEILGGRVKTLHPFVHGGILADRSNTSHMEELERLGIKPIDLVVVNLYPFEETIKKGATLQEAIEQIDIGGPALIRASAKNFKYVTVVVDPLDYPRVVEELERSGEVPLKMRLELARKAFWHTHNYDKAIAQYLERVEV